MFAADRTSSFPTPTRRGKTHKILTNETSRFRSPTSSERSTMSLIRLVGDSIEKHVAHRQPLHTRRRDTWRWPLDAANIARGDSRTTGHATRNIQLSTTLRRI